MKGTGAYAADWKQIATKVKDEAGWVCIRCQHPHDRESGHVLTVHHLTFEKDRNVWWNLAALCQRCHLKIQARVIMHRPWVLEHTDWFKPYVAGFYAWKYLGLNLTRDEVMERLDELLILERQVVLDGRTWDEFPAVSQ